jgi:hypothetical protein
MSITHINIGSYRFTRVAPLRGGVLRRAASAVVDLGGGQARQSHGSAGRASRSMPFVLPTFLIFNSPNLACYAQIMPHYAQLCP